MRKSAQYRRPMITAAAAILGLSHYGHALANNAGPRTTASTNLSACRTGTRPALQVLGSSGPLNAEGRASTSYLLWLGGRPAIIIDTGAGSTANLARAGANPLDLDAILLSHLHPDHVADLPGLLWDEAILNRNRPLLIAGPAGNDAFPGTKVFLERLFGAEGAFPVLQTVLEPASAFHLNIKVINIAPVRSTGVAALDGIEITAYPVPHGKAPSIAYRLDGSDFSAVLGSDQSATDPAFASFARNADVLVLHVALSPRAAGHPFAKSIGLPQTLGKLAAGAGVKRVVLSHLMGFPNTDPAASNFSLANPQEVLGAVRSVYGGEVSLASDLECITFDSRTER
jgi:ribonuclease BN (tRNA processing enzyme)